MAARKEWEQMGRDDDPNVRLAMTLIRQAADSIESIDKMLRGNGGPGLVSEVALLKHDLADIREQIQRIRESDVRKLADREEAEWKFWAKIGAIGAAAAGLVEVIVQALSAPR